MSRDRNIEAIFPLSPMQQGMLFHTLYAESSGIYFRQSSWVLRRGVNAVALRQAWREVIDRHAILRTGFVWEGLREPLQVVYRKVELPWVELDWREIPASRQPEALGELLAGDRAQPFELSRAPLTRLVLIRLGADLYRFVWSYPQLLLDGWSRNLLLDETLARYQGQVKGRPLQLPEPPAYKTYIGWLRQQDLPSAEAFWRAQLQGFSAPPAFGAGRQGNAEEGAAPRYQEASLVLSRATSDRLGAAARSHRVTLNTAVQSAWATLLGRYSGETDVIYGVVVSGRPPELPGIESMIGLFINTLPQRVLIDPESSGSSLMARVQARQLELSRHQWISLLQVQGWSDVPRGETLFRNVFIFENLPVSGGAPPAEPSEPGVEVAHSFEQTNYPLTLVVIPGAQLALHADFDDRSFDRVQVQRMLGHLRVLLEGLAADAEQRLADLPWLEEAERWQLVGEWNDTSVEVPAGCVHEWIAVQAARTPQAPAVVFAGETLSYAELDRRSNQLAHSLRASGVGRGDLVGVLVERSPWMIVGLLGVLKAGAAYVPLDPEYPRERLSFIAADAGLRLLLTQERLAPVLSLPAASVLRLDTEWPEVARNSEAGLPATAGPLDRAYLIYTSGSTGRPKGVEVTHGGLSSFLLSMRERPGLTAADRLVAVTSLSFDIAGLELYLPLLAGARVVLASRQEAMDGEALAGLLASSGATALQATPATWRLLLDAGWPGAPGLVALCGGEGLPEDLAARIRERCAGLWNLYGPTETTIWSAVHEVREGFHGLAPVGRPIANTQIHLLDPVALRPVPLAVAGELCIGGVGLARGYLDRPGLTAERFVPDPFSQQRGARLYRTGDLVRRLPTGALEFLGRMDHQVKVRGFRIELGEIEAELRAHPQVREAVTVVREDAGERRLVSYVVPCEGGIAGDLRLFLKERLPEHMVPSAFVTLERFPLTPNGKLDRRALPAPEAGQGAREEVFAAPRTPVEEVVAGIWCEVLGHERIGRDDDFFALGGHSLLAMQVVSRLRKTFSVEVPLRSLFEAPTIAELCPVLEQAIHAGRGLEAPPIQPVARDRALPLSFAQQRFWLLHQLDPASPAYNMPAAVRIGGPLDIATLARSFAEVVRRHEVLRTTFESIDGEPVQVIAAGSDPALPLVDLAALSAPDREAVARRLAAELARRPFDLQRGPLLRPAVLRLSTEDHIALFTAHHIVSDAWSMRILLQEMATLCRELPAGHGSPLPALPIQYADFACWQRQWLQGEVLEAELAHWRDRLAGAPPVLELPAARPRPAIASFRGARQRIVFPRELSRALRVLSRREGATLFMTLMAGYQALLSRYMGQQDICVGTPVAGRHRLETEALIGAFVNTLVIRADLSGNPRFRDLLRQQREVVLQAHAHQDLPFERLVEELQRERDSGIHPLFQTMFVLQSLGRAGEPAIPGMSRFEIETGSARFDLQLTLVDEETGISGSLEHSVDLFDRVQVQRMLGHLRVLLEGLAADAEQRLADLPWLEEAERWQLVGEWNDTNVEVPAGCVHEWIAAQAARTPQAPAVVFAGEALSYAELDRRSNQLARSLRASGVDRGDLVGVLAERSPWMVVALLGVLKAGAAYVPLDPEYPRERLSFIAADAGLRLLLTQERLAAALSLPAAGMLCLDTQWDEVARHSAAQVPSTAGPLDRAYLIYTSGSTGRPKGVEVTHGALSNFLLSMRERPGLAAADRLVAVTSLSFDIAGLELYLPLLVGARVVLASRQEAMDGEALARLLASSGATALQATPATWRLLLDAGWPGAPGLVALCGGEGLPEDLAARIRERCAGLWNLYGPTETTIWSAVHEVREGFQGLAPLGRPIANTQIHLLDPVALRPVPLAVAGELCIGGVGLARGYLGRPGLTAERFVPDPFSAQRGARLYRTGDLVRRLPSGRLDFLGRMDHQVKVRGFRIELGEIEAALRAHPEVREAAVLVREESGDRRLVAYVVPRPGGAAGELRAFLKERLPEHMVPSAFVVLERFPLTPNGKLDRRALPAPEPGQGAREEAFAAPRTPVEEVVAGIWCEVLGRERIGRNDDFFALGGHSLLATRVASRIRSVFGVELPLRRLFEERTVAELAKSIDAQGRMQSERPFPPIEPMDRGGEIPLSFAQERLWIAHQMDPASSAYNIRRPVKLAGSLDLPALMRALDEVVRRHEALRTIFRSREGRPHQVILPPRRQALPVLDLTGLAELSDQEAWRIVAQESRTPFDLSCGPLLRVLLIRLRAAEHILLFTMHHVITDVWSMNILVSEVGALYSAYLDGLPSPLPELAVQYADFALWQRQWFTEEIMDRELSYWRGRLSGAPDEMALPLDRPHPAQPSLRGANHSFALPAGLSNALEALCRREQVTLFMLLLTAFKVLLYRYAGQEDVVVGTDVANRNRLETEGLIGFFVNNLVLRTDLSGNPTFVQLLKRVREITLDAYVHQDLPFEKLVKGLRVAGRSRQRPLFQVLFVLQDLAAGMSEIRDLEIRPLEMPAESSKFDLSLFVARREHGIAGNWVFSTDVFEPATIQRLAQDLVAVLAHVAKSPESRLDELGLAPKAERAERERKRMEKQERRILSLKSALGRKGIAVAEVDRRL